MKVSFPILLFSGRMALHDHNLVDMAIKPFVHEIISTAHSLLTADSSRVDVNF